jgi:hypothetical protein
MDLCILPTTTGYPKKKLEKVRARNERDNLVVSQKALEGGRNWKRVGKEDFVESYKKITIESFLHRSMMLDFEFPSSSLLHFAHKFSLDVVNFELIPSSFSVAKFFRKRNDICTTFFDNF